MKTVSDFRADMLVILGDASGRRYSESMMDMGLREALTHYRSYYPKKETISQKILDNEGGGMLVLPGFLDPEIEILTVRSENGDWINFSEYRNDRNVYLQLPFSADVPAVGSMLWLELSCPHTIKGLDDRKQTTVPDGHALTVCKGAAGFAMRMRARSVTEVFGKRPEDREALAAQAEVLISDFERELNRIQAAPVDPLPRGNFPI